MLVVNVSAIASMQGTNSEQRMSVSAIKILACISLQVSDMRPLYAATLGRNCHATGLDAESASAIRIPTATNHSILPHSLLTLIQDL